MTDLIRMFTDVGNQRFAEYLETLGPFPDSQVPLNLLSDPEMSQPLPTQAAIERNPGGRAFISRLEFARYLVEKVGNSPQSDISMNHLLWNWLALYYFDQLCPADGRGRRSIREQARYLMAYPYRFDRAYRHLVWGPWTVARLHPRYGEVLLIPVSRSDHALATVGEVYAQLAGRHGVLRSRTVIAAIHNLYFDPVRGRPRSGAGGTGGGSPRRFGTLMRQLECTHDLDWGEASALVELLPKEFDRWKGTGVDTR